MAANVHLKRSLRNLTRLLSSRAKSRSYSTTATAHGADFGLFFDIDGVIVRGRNLLPKAKEAFKLMTNGNGEFIVPTIFVTNAGNTLRANKAKQLSEWLDVQIDEEQVLMSHSPLKMFRQFCDKHVLVSGQGPTREIASNLGFRRVTTIEALRQCFPSLDMVDHKRRKVAPCGFEKYFPRIEAVILFGEPVRWETNLQLIMDVLLTDGHPHSYPSEISYPHIPILGCNMDLMWMAEAPMPRFGHGCFLNCLESLYEKITGNPLVYTALVGKPSEITYHHAENVLQSVASKMGLKGIRRMYCIGDNPDVDIYGANLYNRRIQQHQARMNETKSETSEKKIAQQGRNVAITETVDVTETDTDDDNVSEASSSRSINFSDHCNGGIVSVEDCLSVLVCTGVYNDKRNYASRKSKSLLDHNHRDFRREPELKKPDMMVLNVYDAIHAIFKKEGLS